ncbi:hypothetical protein M514_28697, partial [Trichuris suis]
WSCNVMLTLNGLVTRLTGSLPAVTYSSWAKVRWLGQARNSHSWHCLPLRLNTLQRQMNAKSCYGYGNYWMT